MIERNDPCWCGSGKKYKKCHLHSDTLKGAKPAKPSSIKTPGQIEGMRKAGAFNGQLMDYIRPFVTEGVSTEKLNHLVHTYTLDHGHKPACLGYHGFPKSVCISVNNVVCHGIPSDNEVLKNGDIVNIDLTTNVGGYFGDSSETFFIGNVSSNARDLVTLTAQSLILGIAAAAPGKLLSSIADTIEPFIKSHGCSVVHQYTGHGIGTQFHEHFTVYHHRDKDCEYLVLKPGMTLTIEPMINRGAWQVITDKQDKWTVRTRDGSLSAQFEHTILITETGREILTLTPSQKKAKKIVCTAGLGELKDVDL